MGQSANDVVLQGSSGASGARTKKLEQLLRGSLADKPVTALPGIGHVARANFAQNGVNSVR